METVDTATEPITREQLLEYLRTLAQWEDFEKAHILADGLLLAYINEHEIAVAFDAIGKWYS